MNIGERIRALRKSLGFTQAEFAQKLNLTQGFVSKVEKNQASFTLDHIISIGNIFHVDTGPLIQGESFAVKEVEIGYGRHVTSKGEAIKRVVVILEGMSEQRVFEVLKYAEEKKELVMLQAMGRGTRDQGDKKR